MFPSHHILLSVKAKPGFVRVLKTPEFQEFDFKALKVLEIGFWSLKVVGFLLSIKRLQDNEKIAKISNFFSSSANTSMA